MKVASLAFCIFIYFQVSGQLLEGKVLDRKSRAPLIGATVQFTNTLEGTTTNGEGIFNLTPIVGKQEVVVSHIGYEPVLIDLLKLKGPILLTESIQELESVSIETKSDKKWEKNFKVFKRELLGSSDLANKCEFHNPWVVEFNQNGSQLNASSNQLIEITNKKLGYDIKVMLEKFHFVNNVASYSGKPLFTSKEGKYEKARTRAFYGSKRHFILSLINGLTQDEGYKIFEATYDFANNLFVKGDNLSPDKIVITDGENYWLKLDGYIRVEYTKEPGVSQPQFQIQRRDGTMYSPESSKGQVSFMHSLLPIKISSDGVILNPGLKYFGYWANYERFAYLMPNEYLPERFKEKLVTTVHEIEKIEKVKTMKGFELSDLLIPIEEIHDGGPPKDGIPALTNPTFIRGEEADFMLNSDIVLGFVSGDVAKAYPIKILNYHEIINDKVGDKQVVITFCPLCGSGLAFNAEIDGSKHEFGVSGLLYNSDVLLYDRTTESLWSQIIGKAVSGDLSGTLLTQLPLQQTSWEDWKSKYPNSLVLSDKTGYSMDYSKEAYGLYLVTDELVYPVKNTSAKLPNKERVVGISYKGEFKAYPFSKLKEEKGTVEDIIQGQSFTIHYDKEYQQAWLEPADWEKGVKSTVLFWFAWYAFHPDTKIY